MALEASEFVVTKYEIFTGQIQQACSPSNWANEQTFCQDPFRKLLRDMHSVAMFIGTPYGAIGHLSFIRKTRDVIGTTEQVLVAFILEVIDTLSSVRQNNPEVYADPVLMSMLSIDIVKDERVLVEEALQRCESQVESMGTNSPIHWSRLAPVALLIFGVFMVCRSVLGFHTV